MRHLIALLFLYLPATAQRPHVIALDTPGEKCTIEGTVVNAVTGEPLKKVHISLNSQNSASKYGADTDAAGHYSINGFAAGGYDLTASRTGFATQGFSVEGKTTHAGNIGFTSGQKLTGMDFRLFPQGVITGHVVDEDGDPLANASVAAIVLHYFRGKRQLVYIENSTTNDLGEFRLHSLIAGTYLLSAAPAGQDENHLTTYYPNALRQRDADELTIGPGALLTGITIKISRTPTVAIKGHVNVPAGGEIVSGADHHIDPHRH